MEQPIDETQRSLSSLRIFSGIPAPILASIGRKCAWHQFAASETVVDGSLSKPHAVFFLVEGIIEVLRADCTEQSVPIAELAAPECFDDRNLIADKGGLASIRARTDCILAEMPRERFEGFINACPCVSPGLRDNILSLADVLQGA